MKYRFSKRIVAIIFLFVLLVSFTGCEKNIYVKNEIESIDFAEVFAIDKAPDSENVIISIISERASGSSGESGQPSQLSAYVKTIEGTNVFECVRQMSTWSGKKLFFGHIKTIIIGEDLARSGVLPYLDFFIRDHEFRFNSYVVVTKDVTALEVLEKGSTPDNFIADRLNNLLNNAGAESISGTMMLYEFLKKIECVCSAPYLPYITLEKHTQRLNAEKDDTMDIHLAGYAAFREDKLIGYLDEKQSRGLNWVSGQVVSGIIPIHYGAGGNISMEITKSKVKITPKLENGVPSADIHVSFSSNIGEVMSSTNVFSKRDLANINKLQNDVVKAEVQSLITYAQENYVDVMRIGNLLHHKYPVKAKNYPADWMKYFSHIKITVRVDSKISRTYSIHEPVTHKGGD